MASMPKTVAVAIAVTLMLSLSGCLHADVRYLAGDALNGRGSTTAGGQTARQFVVGRLRSTTTGPVAGATGDAAYLQAFADGTNVIGVIEGSVRPDEFVMVGAHYDDCPS